jgi:hypothetical protein
MFTLEDLEELPTLAQGQTGNLKIENKDRRVWLSRCTVADGEPYDNMVTIERRRDGRWVTATTYEAK